MNAQSITTQLNQLPEVTRTSMAVQFKMLAAMIRERDAREAAARAEAAKTEKTA